MSELSDEQLREWRDRYPNQPYAEQWSGKELITELLTLRAERDAANALLREADLQLEYLDGRFPTGTTPPIRARIADHLGKEPRA